MHRNVVVTLVVTALCFSSSTTQLHGQETSPSPKAEVSPFELMQRDMAARKKALISEEDDLEAMAKSLSGMELDSVLSIDQKAGQGVMQLDATLWFAAIYKNMQCDADREVARNVLKNRLAFYAHLFDMEAEQVAAHLAFVRLPATAQSGQRIKEDLRAAKATLEEMDASLK